MKLPGAAFSLLLAAMTAAAAEDDRRCFDGHIDEELAALQTGRIVGRDKRVHFHGGSDKADACPAATAACAEKAYVVPGDHVLVAPSRRTSGFVCAAFVSAKGTVTAGWLQEAAVDARPAPPVPAGGWIGTWKYLNSTIKITRGKRLETLSVEGDSWVQRYQSANVGEIHGDDVPLAGNSLGFAMKQDETAPIDKADQYECAVKLVRLHDLLVVHDNGNCGGAGVHFTGFYRRKR